MYHVLCKALCKARLMSFLDKVPQCKSITVCVTACKALISHVEKWVVAAFLDRIRNGLPLILCGINACRVVRTCVEKHDAVFWHGLDVRYHAFEIKADGLWVVVPVFLDLQPGVTEHSRMVGPARRWNVHSFGVGIEALE